MTVLTAVAQKCIARTGRPGETLQVYYSYSISPDVMRVCAVTCVPSFYPLLGTFPGREETSPNPRRKQLEALGVGSFVNE